MSFAKIEILGLRGFSDLQTLNLGLPDGNIGSGLTIIVGPNNSGKSTIYEAFRAISSNNPPSFASGQRNKKTGGKIKISIKKTDGTSFSLITSKVGGGSETQFEPKRIHEERLSFFTLPARRGFPPFFSKDVWTRQQFTDQTTFNPVRSTQLEHFFRRLFKIQQEKETFDSFNSVLSKVLGQIPDWCIELSDNQQHYLKFENNGSAHNSDGTGDGLLSIFTITDALYDSKPGDLIFIDEPELSLHPTLQKKLAKLFNEYSSDRQILISTHSPYFINWTAVKNGGKIARTVKEKTGTKIYELQVSTATKILRLLNDMNNPHTLGLDAKEIFFLDDNILLVEGQEDVIFLNKILELKNIILNGTFFGWGVGGADKTDKVLAMLYDLGFKKITVIFDNNKKHLIAPLKKKFGLYYFTFIPTDDVRDKKEKNIKGLIDFGGKTINKKYDKAIEKLCTNINNYLIS
ncbi:hypothetical protein ES708_22141 [subsurface metagenome]